MDPEPSPNLDRDYSRYVEFLRQTNHDLKSPIRQIDFFYGQLENELHDKLSKPNVEIAKLARTAINHATNQFDRIGTLSKIYTTNHPRTKIQLNDFISSIARDTLSKDVFELNFFHSPAHISDVFIEVEVKLLSLLLNEVFDNIQKYSKKELMKIDVGIAFNQQEVTIRIQDNGPGINNNQIKEAVIPFRRFHSPNEVPGVGLGLTIAQQCAEKMGGSLRLENNNGLMVKIDLPSAVDTESEDGNI